MKQINHVYAMVMNDGHGTILRNITNPSYQWLRNANLVIGVKTENDDLPQLFVLKDRDGVQYTDLSCDEAESLIEVRSSESRRHAVAIVTVKVFV